MLSSRNKIARKGDCCGENFVLAIVGGEIATSDGECKSSIQPNYGQLQFKYQYQIVAIRLTEHKAFKLSVYHRRCDKPVAERGKYDSFIVQSFQHLDQVACMEQSISNDIAKKFDAARHRPMITNTS